MQAQIVLFSLIFHNNRLPRAQTRQKNQITAQQIDYHFHTIGRLKVTRNTIEHKKFVLKKSAKKSKPKLTSTLFLMPNVPLLPVA